MQRAETNFHTISFLGFFDQNRVADMVKESVKMYGFEHPHVLSVIGVCVDAGPAPYIVMPFMANGSLLTYIKKEKMNLVVPIDSDDHQLASINLCLFSSSIQLLVQSKLM